MKPSLLKKLRPIGENTRNGVHSVLDDLFLAPFTTKDTTQIHDTEDTSDTNPIIGTYRTHIVFLFQNWFLSSLFLLLFIAIIWGIGVVLSLPLSFIFTLVCIVMIPLLLGVVVRSITMWVANATVIRQRNLVFHKYHGIYSQSVEVRSIAQIKSFDLIQHGMMEYVCDYGDIEVASIISGASTNIVLKNICPVKSAYKTLSKHIESLENDNEQANDENEEKRQ